MIRLRRGRRHPTARSRVARVGSEIGGGCNGSRCVGPGRVCFLPGRSNAMRVITNSPRSGQLRSITVCSVGLRSNHLCGTSRSKSVVNVRVGAPAAGRRGLVRRLLTSLSRSRRSAIPKHGSTAKGGTTGGTSGGTSLPPGRSMARASPRRRRSRARRSSSSLRSARRSSRSSSRSLSRSSRSSSSSRRSRNSSASSDSRSRRSRRSSSSSSRRSRRSSRSSSRRSSSRSFRSRSRWRSVV